MFSRNYFTEVLPVEVNGISESHTTNQFEGLFALGLEVGHQVLTLPALSKTCMMGC